MYVDGLNFLSKDENDIHDLDIKLREFGVDLDQEDDTAGFLGVTLERNNKTGLLEMRQDGLIEQIFEALGLDCGIVTKNHTPSEGKPFVRYKSGPPYHVQFSYGSVVGIMMYLVGHILLNITYAVNFCAQYIFSPNHFHELALNQIGHYLKSIIKKGLVLNPSLLIFRIDCFLDANVSGMYGH